MEIGVRTQERFYKGVSALLILTSLFLMISRISFDPNDISYYSWPAQNPTANWGGGLGAQLVYILLMSFGEGFWWVPAILIIWALVLSQGSKLSVLKTIYGLSLLLPATAIVLAILSDVIPNWGPSLGGVAGWRYAPVLLGVIGPGGTWMLIGCGVLGGLWLLQPREIYAQVDWSIFKRLKSNEAAQPKPSKKKSGAKSTEGEESSEDELMPDVRVKPAPAEERRGTPPADPDLIVNDEPEDEPYEEEEVGTPQVPQGIIPPEAKNGEYILPTVELLAPPPPPMAEDKAAMQEQAGQLEAMFAKFKVICRVIGMVRGPSITQFEMTIDEGTRVNKVTTLADNIALTLKAPNVRIVAPIPGKNTIGIEIPNQKKEMVNLGAVLNAPECSSLGEQMRLPLILGKDVVGAPLVEDLAKMPHLLVAGTTGSGKSVCINSIIISLIFYHRPDQVRLLMIDPKMVEMAAYEGIPHLMRPVITNMDEAAAILDWACRTMDERYAMLTRMKVKDIVSYNRLKPSKIKEVVGEEGMEKMEIPMPYIVIIVDEFSDLMMTGAKEIESYITRLAQKSRAVGIHVVLATQRPSVDVITGLIKTNMPSRIAFQVAAKVDSRTILDQNGADKLMGKGDMLFMPPGGASLMRAQGVFIEDQEIFNIVDFWKAQGEPVYVDSAAVSQSTGGDGKSEKGSSADDDSKSEDFANAIELVIQSGRPSASYLQRQLRIGYNRASRYVELMETMGVVGPPKGSKGREILWSQQDYEEYQSSR